MSVASSEFLPSIASNSLSFKSTINSVVTSASEKRDRQINYKKTLVSSVHLIDCKCLYRVLMKIEIPFRGAHMKSRRHQFIKLLYEESCSHDPNYEEIIGFIKQHLGLYISITDARQLVLYSALFNETDFFSKPTNEEIRQVIKRCPLAVPPFTYFKKWSKEVKKLESNPKFADITKGYFAKTQSSNKSESVSIMNMKEDIDNFNDEYSGSNNSSDSEDDSFDDGTSDKNRSPKKVPKRDMKTVMKKNTKKVMLLSRLFDNEEGSDNSPKNRKKGAANLYERSDNHHLNKMILAMSRGEKTYDEPAKDFNKNDIAHRFSTIFVEGKENATDIDREREEEEKVEEEEKRELERAEQKRLEKKRRKDLKKLTDGINLKPSIAKLSMIKKLREKKKQESEATSWKSLVDSDDDECNTSRQLQEEFHVMSM